MEKKVLITEARDLLNRAEADIDSGNDEAAAVHLTDTLVLLTEELVVAAPAEPEAPTPDGTP